MISTILIVLLIVTLWVGVVALGYREIFGPAPPKKPSLHPLWLQWGDCHEDIESGIVTASGVLRYGGRAHGLESFTKEWRPPFEGQISANGRDIDVIVCDISITVGSRDVTWRAQDKASYMSQHTFQ